MDNKSHTNGCALCGTRLISHSNPFEEKIGEKSYKFDTKDCAVMFKRFLAVYGDDFRLLSGKTACIIPKGQETKPSRKEEKQRRNDRPREKRSEGVEIIKDPIRTQHLFDKLINSAREKIEILFSSINLFYYYNHHKKTEEGFQHLERVAAKKGLDVKIITPSDKNIKEITSKISNKKKLFDIQIRCIEETCFLGNKIMLLLVDNKQSLALQLMEKEEEYAEGGSDCMLQCYE